MKTNRQDSFAHSSGDDSINTPVRAVAMVHCHFEPGGVTQVVQNHLKCLLPDTDVVLVSGPRTSGLRQGTGQDVASLVIDALEYDSLQHPETRGNESSVSAADETFAALDESLRNEGLHPGDCLIHWHNHSLGKNAASPLLIAKLAQAGWRLLLQIHDFAEDQRPTNYRHLIERLAPADASRLSRDWLDQLLYPSHSHINYAVLTAGDADVLIGAGIDAARVHLIPNSVDLPTRRLDRTTAMRKISDAFGVDARSRWLLYPVRGIRRKNVGEFLLWCQLLRLRNEVADRGRTNEATTPYVGGLTLRPTTPTEAASYDRWKEVAQAYVPNVVFDAGEHPDISFIDNLAACHCVLSTSVAEGFGMAFLEPWLADRRVIARDLPAVTSGFTRDGLRLTDLYASAWIPGPPEWIEQKNRLWSEQAGRAWTSLPESMRPCRESAAGSVDQSRRWTDRIDFARLVPADQIGVIRRISEDDAFARTVITMNRKVLDAIESKGDDADLAHNRAIIEVRYQADVQREQLHTAYRQSMSDEGDIVRSDDLPTPVQETSDGHQSHVPYASHVDPQTPERVIDLVNRCHPFYPCRVESL